MQDKLEMAKVATINVYLWKNCTNLHKNEDICRCKQLNPGMTKKTPPLNISAPTLEGGKGSETNQIFVGENWDFYEKRVKKVYLTQ